MLNIERALKQDRLLRALTGFNRKAFDALLSTFSTVYKQSLLQQPRMRAMGGGRKARLRTEQDKLFYILLYYFKCYPTFDLAGLLFDIDRAQAHHWMHRLQPILETALGQKMARKERKLSSIEEFIARFPDVERVMIDSTERPIQHPKNPEQQKQNYSGKKRRHTRSSFGSSRPSQTSAGIE